VAELLLQRLSLMLMGELPGCYLLWFVLLLLPVMLHVQVGVVRARWSERVVVHPREVLLQMTVVLQWRWLPPLTTAVAAAVTTEVSEPWGAVVQSLLRLLRRVEPGLRAARVDIARRRLRRCGANPRQQQQQGYCQRGYHRPA
jgi:hypothetical protein